MYAYEILYRGGTENQYFNVDDGDSATSNVILNSFQTIGLDRLTFGKPAFINFTDNLLKKEIATLFPPNKLVIEILETVYPDDDIIEKCKYLKSKGYTIALDDFIPELNPLIEFADIIKVDFLNTDMSEINRITAYLQEQEGIILLAEKVEDHRMFEIAKELGYSLFQGYFFSKPVIISQKDIPPVKLNYLQLLSEINKPEVDFEKIVTIINRDVYLTYMLLKLINSALFGLKRKITSVKEVLVLLGEKELRKWISLIILKGMDENTQDQVVQLSMIRAKFAEEIAYLTPLKNRSADLFLSGLFSLLDVLIGRPLSEILEELPISEDIKEILVNNTGKFKETYALVEAFEKGEWGRIALYESTLGLSQGEITKAYINSLSWCKMMME